MPVRTCIGCRSTQSADLMRRVTADANGDPVTDDSAHRGRGAWLCPRPSCLETAAERRAFSRAFRRRIADRNFADRLLGWIDQRDQS